MSRSVLLPGLSNRRMLTGLLLPQASLTSPSLPGLQLTAPPHQPGLHHPLVTQPFGLLQLTAQESPCGVSVQASSQPELLLDHSQLTTGLPTRNRTMPPSCSRSNIICYVCTWHNTTTIQIKVTAIVVDILTTIGAQVYVTGTRTSC